jgi:nucleoside-diphosphate-sugar epimerase
MKKILVTGGNGFIGGHVVDNLIDKGYDPIIFDRVKNKGKNDRKDVQYFYGDTKNAGVIDEAIYHSDGVIHLAGVLGTQETVNNPVPSVETNIIGGLNVFESCARNNKKGVYIAVGNHWMNNSYSITKTTAERFALMYNKEKGTEIAVVRGLNAYGARQKDKPVRKITPNFILSALKNEDILVYGNGNQKMDMIHVGDLAEILVRGLTMDHGCYDKIFEAGTGKAPTVNEIAETVIRLTGSKSKLEHTAMRPGEDKNSTVVGNVETLKPLDFEEFVSLEEGLNKTIPWYRELLRERGE